MSALNAQHAGMLDAPRPPCAPERDGGDGLRDEFLALASHELMTPLTSLRLQVQRKVVAIAREIVRAHGGSIGVESAPGRGATFTVELPLD
ncbi:ATP-binding protein [Sorangium sp. So ce315]|uniref:ATP-binding protein n=1 Tax=Sorangium sp. So ce315 TaxID=3133299 RepID=UPI003F641FB5